MKKTIFIAGPLHAARPLLVSMLEPFAYVLAFSTAGEMEKELQEQLLPDLLILSVMGDPDDDQHFITLLERYWEGGMDDLILILPFPIERAKEPLFYTPYARQHFVQPVVVEDIVAAVQEMIRNKEYRHGESGT